MTGRQVRRADNADTPTRSRTIALNQPADVWPARALARSLTALARGCLALAALLLFAGQCVRRPSRGWLRLFGNVGGVLLFCVPAVVVRTC